MNTPNKHEFTKHEYTKQTKNRNKTIVAWEEIFNGYNLQNFPNGLIIDVWKDEPTLLSVAKANLNGILR